MHSLCDQATAAAMGCKSEVLSYIGLNKIDSANRLVRACNYAL